MPNVMGREFPYTPEGMAAAEDYRSSMGMRGGGMMGFRPVGYQDGDLVESVGPALQQSFSNFAGAPVDAVNSALGAYEALNPQNLERVEDTQMAPTAPTAPWNQRQFGDPPGETFSQGRYRGNWLLMNGDTPYPGDPTGGTTWSDFYRAYVRELGKEAADRIIDGQIEGSGGSIPYFNPSEQHNPFHNPNVAEVANGGLMSLARRRGYAG